MKIPGIDSLQKPRMLLQGLCRRRGEAPDVMQPPSAENLSTSSLLESNGARGKTQSLDRDQMQELIVKDPGIFLRWPCMQDAESIFHDPTTPSEVASGHQLHTLLRMSTPLLAKGDPDSGNHQGP